MCRLFIKKYPQKKVRESGLGQGKKLGEDVEAHQLSPQGLWSGGITELLQIRATGDRYWSVSLW